MEPVSAINVELVERFEKGESENGVFSYITQSMMPIYYGRHGSEDISSKGGCLSFSTTKPNNRRLIRKNGKSNLTRSNNPLRRMAYIRDIGNTLVNSRWKWTLLCFASSYVLCWLLFAATYMLVARDNSGTSESTACFFGVTGFAGYFLLSLETQQTIGYGTRYITPNCIEAVFLISVQMITSIAICGAMTTIVYTKMVRPQKWTTRTLFSKIAVICQQDGYLCLIFRVRDDDNKHGISTKINAYLVQTKTNEPRLKSLTLENGGILLWPLEIVHKITPSSPFWDLSAKDLITHRFELVVIMQGTSLITGQCSKSSSSYLSTEILWGHRFKPCVKFNHEKEVYFVDHSVFNQTEEVLTPLCSAQRLEEVIEELIASPMPAYYSKSPAVSSGYQEDEESLGTSSSGIGSMRDEQLSPIAKKLSTIIELNSNESIVTDESEDGLQLLNKRNCFDSERQRRVSGGLDVESLIASLQNYLDENCGTDKNTYKFCDL